VYPQRRRDRFSLASALDPLKPVDGAAQLSLNGGFIAKDLIKCIAIRNYVLCDGDFAHRSISRLSKFLKKDDGACHRKQGKKQRAFFRI